MPLGLGTLTRAVFKRARRGLYAGKKILSGNNVSEDGGNRTRRVWLPNAHQKKLYSHILNRMIRIRVTAAALRNIDKAGGLDRYILTTPPKKLDSDFGEELREQLLLALQKQGKQPLHLPKAAQAAIGASIGARQL